MVLSQGRHSRWIKLAQKKAAESSFWPYKMCAVVVKSNRVIAIGYNKAKPGITKHPAYRNKAIHAELQAILSVDSEKLKGSTIYVGGISRCGNTIMSKPCPLCQNLLKEMGIKCAVWHNKENEVETWKVS